MQNIKYILKIKEIYIEWNTLNMKEYLKIEYFESVPCAPSKSAFEDTTALFLFTFYFSILQLWRYETGNGRCSLKTAVPNF